MFSPQRWHHVWVRSARDISEHGSSFGDLHVSEQRIATMYERTEYVWKRLRLAVCGRFDQRIRVRGCSALKLKLKFQMALSCGIDS
jgi:hypothetical protein